MAISVTLPKPGDARFAAPLRHFRLRDAGRARRIGGAGKRQFARDVRRPQHAVCLDQHAHALVSQHSPDETDRHRTVGLRDRSEAVYIDARSRNLRDMLGPAHLRARRVACAAPSQARPDESRASRVGPRRRARARHRRHRPGAHRRPHLLGEPDATRALCPVRARRRDLSRPDRRGLGGLARLDEAHRTRVALVRALVLRVPAGIELPARHPRRGR